MRLLLLAASCVLLVGCGEPATQPSQPTITPGAPFQLTSAQLTEIKNSVRANMKDPDSARFGPIVASRKPNNILHVCGYVNGKNSFGGYTGMTPFSGVAGDIPPLFYFSLSSIGGTESKDYAIVATCRDFGVPI